VVKATDECFSRIAFVLGSALIIGSRVASDLAG
jgi:hypothetical protein